MSSPLLAYPLLYATVIEARNPRLVAYNRSKTMGKRRRIAFASIACGALACGTLGQAAPAMADDRLYRVAGVVERVLRERTGKLLIEGAPEL